MSDEKNELEKLAELHMRREFRRATGKQERDIWIAAARLYFVASERTECFVCGKFKSISQAHHVIPLAEQYDRGFSVPDNEHVWLCPNHHAIIHAFIPSDKHSLKVPARRNRGKRHSAIHPDLSDGEFEKVLLLIRRSARDPQE